MTSTSGAAVTLSSLGRKLELKPEDDTQMSVSWGGGGVHRSRRVPDRFSFPHFRNAGIVVSIQRGNKNHRYSTTAEQKFSINHFVRQKLSSFCSVRKTKQKTVQEGSCRDEPPPPPFCTYWSIAVCSLPRRWWWFHKRGRRGSKSGRGLAGSSPWGRGSMEPGRCGKNDLLNRGLRQTETVRESPIKKKE